MTPETLTRMHVALNVGDLDRSIAFYRRALGREPAKQRADYAKFELDEPPLVLSLNPAGPASGGQRLSHLGVRLRDGAALEAVRARLATSGLELREERNVTCCHAVQDKFWVSDPDGNEWEFYQLLQDTDERYPAVDSCCAVAPEDPAANCCASPRTA